MPKFSSPLNPLPITFGITFRRVLAFPKLPLFLDTYFSKRFNWFYFLKHRQYGLKKKNMARKISESLGRTRRFIGLFLVWLTDLLTAKVGRLAEAVDRHVLPSVHPEDENRVLCHPFSSAEIIVPVLHDVSSIWLTSIHS